MLGYNMHTEINLKTQTAVNHTGDLGVKCNLFLSEEIQRADTGTVNEISTPGSVLVSISLF